ncbi:MAG TPA: hypothetical protein VFF87_11375 [Hyphomicrobium sp.]|nr:hypothetical protein [Hyphomicrobium sp.]
MHDPLAIVFNPSSPPRTTYIEARSPPERYAALHVTRYFALSTYVGIAFIAQRIETPPADIILAKTLEAKGRVAVPYGRADFFCAHAVPGG